MDILTLLKTSASSAQQLVTSFPSETPFDRDFARQVGGGIASSQTSTEPITLWVDYPECVRRVLSAAHLQVDSDRLPQPEWTSRNDWISNTVEMAHGMISMREGIKRVTGRPDTLLIAGQVGSFAGVFSKMVLGQFEHGAFTDGKPRLMMLNQNIVERGSKMNISLEDFTRWILLHETTHAVQFANASWLAPYMRRQINELMENPKTLRKRISAIQGMMSLVEGHADLIMDVAGEGWIPVKELRDSMDLARENPSPLMRILKLVTGMDAKMKQYTQGRAFCDAVVATDSYDLLNKAWEKEENLPTLAEIKDASIWVKRIQG